METFQSLLAKKLSDALAAAALPEVGELTPATDQRFGDYQTNAALVLGKQRGENPRELAEKIIGHLNVGDLCEPPVVAGPGFINFTLRPGAIAEKTASILGDEKLGVVETESPFWGTRWRGSQRFLGTKSSATIISAIGGLNLEWSFTGGRISWTGAHFSRIP